ncbi:type II toxin-antitoxin system VapC family toxin [Candidatus Gottesmanbacteria bacterium]|nr:type II toxin-antitoxin system VapC family toxin [Candidatus Gottesmanbacteria bacterium]
MLRIIIDASVVLKWIPGEDEELVSEARQIYEMMMDDKLEVYAPTFLLIEVLNILTRKRKAKSSLVKKDIKLLSGGKIKLVDLNDYNFNGIVELIYKYKLTAYDGLYCYLAKVKNCKLLTADKQLLKLHDLTIDIGRFLKLMKSN